LRVPFDDVANVDGVVGHGGEREGGSGKPTNDSAR
jgi:hypothetical protein